ncbi:MAG: hypothetical protein J6C19_05630 [Lachnospiraceae bacterium]|nr:hypothetical protein [Lachnospiraceae bacterium]
MKLITANKLNRLWKNGVLPALTKKIDSTKVLKTMEQVEANTNAENIPSAVVAAEMYNKLGGLSFYEDSDGNKYVVGADAVPKKLGEGEYTVQTVTVNGATTATLSLVEYAPNNYMNLEVGKNIFIVSMTKKRSGTKDNSSTVTITTSMSLSYNQSNGTLSISCPMGITGSGTGGTHSFSADIAIVDGK